MRLGRRTGKIGGQRLALHNEFAIAFAPRYAESFQAQYLSYEIGRVQQCSIALVFTVTSYEVAEDTMRCGAVVAEAQPAGREQRGGSLPPASVACPG